MFARGMKTDDELDDDDSVDVFMACKQLFEDMEYSDDHKWSLILHMEKCGYKEPIDPTYKKLYDDLVKE